jgi:hypothetical protein
VGVDDGERQLGARAGRARAHAARDRVDDDDRGQEKFEV